MFLKVILHLAINLIILLIINQLVTGFELANQPLSILSTAVVFTALNSYFRPILKVILSPLILITLGAFSLAINAGILYLLDIISDNISINGLMPLWQSTLIITIFNVLIGVFL